MSRRKNSGVVLVICLMIIMVVSLAAVTSVRLVGLSEQNANATRKEALATQAAEAALNYCEEMVTANAKDPSAGMVPQKAPSGSATPDWADLASWDGAGSTGKVTRVGYIDSAEKAEFMRRSPECMAHYQTSGNTTTVVITARGFGPEVAPVDINRTRPKGTEVWLQAIVTLN